MVDKYYKPRSILYYELRFKIRHRCDDTRQSNSYLYSSFFTVYFLVILVLRFVTVPYYEI